MTSARTSDCYFPEGKEAIFAEAVGSVVEIVFEALVGQLEATPSAWEKLALYARGRISAFDRELIMRSIEEEIWLELRPTADDARGAN